MILDSLLFLENCCDYGCGRNASNNVSHVGAPIAFLADGAAIEIDLFSLAIERDRSDFDEHGALLELILF